MPFARTNLARGALSLGLCPLLWAALPATLNAGGVTLITHGNNSDTKSWVSGMAQALSVRLGGNIPIYRIDVASGGPGLTTTVTKISGGTPLGTPCGEIILMLDWGPVSTGGTTTYAVADAVAPLFGQTNLIGELDGHALAEVPVHIVGHSRGGSLVCELSRKLGEQGLWVDQVTSLDAYPLGSDAPALSYEHVLFSESYYQTANLFIDGQIVPGSFWRKQTQVSGGYDSFLIDGHSDVHVWYHGTIDLATPATNGDNAVITATMRDSWWTAFEQKGTNSGFIHSQLGGGDRLSPSQPNGSNSSPIRDGFNRYYDVGGGDGAVNRTPVGSNSGEWPNPIRFELLTTNRVAPGDTATLEIYFQWAQSNTSTQSVQVLADPDRNPFNGNELLLENGFATGTTVAQVGYGNIEVGFDGLIPPGDYDLCVKMAAAGRARFLYASQSITMTASLPPLTLDIASTTNSAVRLGVNGVAGQTAILEVSRDGLPWMPVATNTLGGVRWESLQPIDPEATVTRFRAVEASP